MEFIVSRPKIQNLVNSKSKILLKRPLTKNTLYVKAYMIFLSLTLKKPTILQHNKNVNKQRILTQVRSVYRRSAVMHLQTIGLKLDHRLNAPLNVHKQVEHLFRSIYVLNAPINAAS